MELGVVRRRVLIAVVGAGPIRTTPTIPVPKSDPLPGVAPEIGSE